MTKLTIKQVKEIRKKYAANITQKALAGRYGVKRKTISDIITRRNWRHIK